jgi:hypothetical protein
LSGTITQFDNPADLRCWLIVNDGNRPQSKAKGVQKCRDDAAGGVTGAVNHNAVDRRFPPEKNKEYPLLQHQWQGKNQQAEKQRYAKTWAEDKTEREQKQQQLERNSEGALSFPNLKEASTPTIGPIALE